MKPISFDRTPADFFDSYTTVIYRCECGKIKEEKYRGKMV